MAMKPTTYVALQEALISETTTSTEVDLGPYVNVGHFQVNALWGPGIYGADTDETYACKLQESADTVSTNFADVTGGAFTDLTQASSIAAQMLTFVPQKRYIRAVTTLGGTTPTIVSYVGLIVTGRFDT